VSGRSWFCVLAIIALLLGVGTSARLDAQVVGGTLSGTVTDQTGGAVPNASVAIKDNATGEIRDVTTTSDGLYTAPNLTPGVYTVTLTAPGFQKNSAVQRHHDGWWRANLKPDHADRAGDRNDSSHAEAPVVNLSNAEIGGITTEAAIKELPLNGRSWSDLANLTSGVYELHVQPNLSSRDRFTRGYGVQLSISGSRPQQIIIALTVSASTILATAVPAASWAPIPRRCDC